MRRLGLLAVAACWLGAVSAAHAEEQCVGLFEDVRGQIETDYLGYVQAIAPDAERLAAHRDTVARSRAEASASSVDDCTLVMQRFIATLNDPHVFLLERPQLTDTEAVAFRAAADRRDVSTLRSRSRLRSPGVEGVWVAPDFDVTIVPDGPRRRGNFIAIVTQSRNEAWAPGDVAARFTRNGDDWIATLYRSEDRAPLRSPAALQREGEMLHMPPATWGRRLPAASRANFNAASPRAPFYANLNERIALVTLPSFSPEHRQEIVDMLAAHDADIRARDVLIVDLRGNEGGSSGLGQLLAPYYYTAEQRAQTGPRTYPLGLSSPRWISYYGLIRDSIPPGEDRDFFSDFIRRMEASPGALVPYFEDAALAAQLYATPAPDTVHETPAHVAIIVDRHSVSAAEAFVLTARRSGRVTIFGEPTGGSIDYQSVSMTGAGQGRLRHLLGLPSSAASDELPARGFNASGVPVDVSLTGEGDWIAAVERHYARR